MGEDRSIDDDAADERDDAAAVPPKTSMDGLPDSITFTLSKPVTFQDGDDDVTARTITLREPTAADLARMTDFR